MTVYKSKKATKDGRQYFFRIKYKDIYGISHDYTSRKYKKEKDAKDEEALYRIKIAENKVHTSTITIEQAFTEYLAQEKNNLKKQTIKKIENLFTHLKSIEKYKINDINLNIYKKWYLELENSPFSVHHKNKILGLFKRIIKYSSLYYNTSDSIIKFVNNFKEVGAIKKEMEFFTYEEYLKFDSVITDHDWHTFFEILYFLGLRQGECTALNWNDIDFEKGTIRINKSLTTKIKGEEWTISSPKTKNSIRTLPLTKNILNDLKSIYNEVSKYKDFKKEWFIFGNTIPFKENRIQLRKNKYCKLAEVKQIRVHDFRHSCASLLINKGANITLVSKYLGHSNISITLNTYTHLYKNQLTEMTEILNNL